MRRPLSLGFAEPPPLRGEAWELHIPMGFPYERKVFSHHILHRRQFHAADVFEAGGEFVAGGEYRFIGKID